MRGLLLYGDTERSAAMRHEVPIAIIDPLLFAEVDGRRYVLTTQLESERVKRVLDDVEVLDYIELGFRELVKDGMAFADAGREIEARAMRQIGIREAVVPGDFPLALGDRLREDGVVLTIDDAAVELRRRAKSAEELEGIRVAARAAEAGMAAAAALLAGSEPDEGGHLTVDGEPLRAEDIREALRAACAERGAPCPPDVIVASVWQGGGHEPGSGPLPAGLPIHVDLWPRHEESACWADMARTFVVGDPAPQHAELIARLSQPSGPGSPAASCSTASVTRSRRPATRRSARPEAARSKASSTHSATASASRCTRRRRSGLPATTRSSPATWSRSSPGSGTAASGA